MSWSVVLSDTRFVFFEDPLTGTHIPKQEYHDMYGRACEELFSEDVSLQVRMFFEESPVTQGCWLFRDDDARADLFDVAVEMKLVDRMEEFCAGETDIQKRRRLQMEKEQAKTHARPNVTLQRAKDRESQLQRLLQLEKTFETKEDLSNKQRKRMERELRGLRASLANSI